MVIEEWEKDGIKYAIKRLQFEIGSHYCGYCTFEKRPVREHGYHGILVYAPVHGGITYAEQKKDGSITYGFDCAHCNDRLDPKCRDMGWLRAECERMAQAIQMAVSYEPAYLLAKSNEEKAEVIQAYHDQMAEHGIEFELTDNFGAMINTLFGEL